MSTVAHSQAWLRLTKGLIAVVAMICLAPSGARNDSPLSENALVSVSEIEGTAAGQVDSPVWERLPTWRILLEPAPTVHPAVEIERRGQEGDSLELQFQTARDGERLYFRFRWSDPTHDFVTDRVRTADGIAVQFALNGDTDTNYMMGSVDKPVNIWYWRAHADRAGELAAAGFGTTAQLDRNLDIDSSYISGSESDNGEGYWVVVLSNTLRSKGEYSIRLDRFDEIPIAFAVWQGSKGQRDGNKLTNAGWVRLAVASGE